MDRRLRGIMGISFFFRFRLFFFSLFLVHHQFKWRIRRKKNHHILWSLRFGYWWLMDKFLYEKKIVSLGFYEFDGRLLLENHLSSLHKIKTSEWCDTPWERGKKNYETFVTKIGFFCVWWFIGCVLFLSDVRGVYFV